MAACLQFVDVFAESLQDVVLPLRYLGEMLQKHIAGGATRTMTQQQENTDPPNESDMIE